MTKLERDGKVLAAYGGGAPFQINFTWHRHPRTPDELKRYNPDALLACGDLVTEDDIREYINLEGNGYLLEKYEIHQRPHHSSAVLVMRMDKRHNVPFHKLAQYVEFYRHEDGLLVDIDKRWTKMSDTLADKFGINTPDNVAIPQDELVSVWR